MDWVQQAMRKMVLAELSPRIAVQSSGIPEMNRRDPADRILVATARETNAVLVTHDELLLELGRGKFLSVYDPSNHN